jgi:hypothetical protein
MQQSHLNYFQGSEPGMIRSMSVGVFGLLSLICCLATTSALAQDYPCTAAAGICDFWVAAQAPGDPSSYFDKGAMKAQISDIKGGDTLTVNIDEIHVRSEAPPAGWNPKDILRPITRGKVVQVLELKNISGDGGQLWLRIGVPDVVKSVFRAGAGRATLPSSSGQFVLDPLMARAVVLDDGTTRIAIVSVDMRGVLNGSRSGDSTKTVTNVRNRVLKSGVQGVIIVATHDHSDPVDFASAGADGAIKFESRIAEAILQANDNLKPARLAVDFSGEATESFNRVSVRPTHPAPGEAVNFVSKLGMQRGCFDSFDPDGKGGFLAGPGKPPYLDSDNGCADSPACNVLTYDAQGQCIPCRQYRAEHPNDPIDDTVGVVLIQAADGTHIIATLINYAAHAAAFGTQRVTTGDWPGKLMSKVEADIGGTALFLQGAAGDVDTWVTNGAVVNPDCDRPTLQATTDIGYRIAAVVVNEANGLMSGAGKPFSVPHRVTYQAQHYPLPDPGDKIRSRCPMGIPQTAELNIVAIDQIFSIATFPGEFFTWYGMELKRQSPFSNTMFVGYANDHIGYVTDERSYLSGAFATVPETYMCVEKNVGNVLLTKALEMLRAAR